MFNYSEMKGFCMRVDLFELPTMDDGIHVVETKFCELLNIHRGGYKLEPEVLDWMDSANTWLITSEI